MEITFLGTGGGRFNLIKQVRRTAGFYLSGALRMHIDPGPGSLAACRAYGIDPEKTRAVVATHNHIDHMNDAALMLEAVNCFPGRKKGVFISTASMLEGDEYGERGISSYFTGKAASAVVARQGKPIRIGSATLLPTPVRHEDRAGFGFVLSMGGFRLGYTSDTEYFPSLHRHFMDCDLLVANCLKPKPDKVGGHLHSASAAQLLSECRPKLCALSHMGMSFLRAGPEREAAKIARQSGVRTIAATDGMRIALPSLKVRK
jgi:ribonuclease BN (tRNA processing enzyme)